MPVLVFTEILTIAANELLGVDPFLKVVAAVAIVFMSFALVGLAIGLGARYPRFGADPSQVAGSYGGVAFMILAVLFIIVDDRAGRLALVCLCRQAGARYAVDHLGSARHRRRLRRDAEPERGHLADRHALRREWPRVHEPQVEPGDPGSGIRDPEGANHRVPDPGSRSGSRIPDPGSPIPIPDPVAL